MLSGLLMVQTSPMNMLSSTIPLGSSARASNLHTDHQRKVRAHPLKKKKNICQTQTTHCHGSHSFSKPYSASDWLLLIQGSMFKVSSLIPRGKIVVQKGDTTVQNSKTLNTLCYITLPYITAQYHRTRYQHFSATVNKVLKSSKRQKVAPDGLQMLTCA